MSQKANKLQFSYNYYKEQCLKIPILAVLVTGYLIGLNVYSVFKKTRTSSYSGIGPFLKENGVELFFTVMLVAILSLVVILLLRCGIHLLKEGSEDAVMVTGKIQRTKAGTGIVLNGTEYYLPKLGEFEKGDTISALVLPKSKLVLEMVASEDHTVTEKEIADTKINKVKFAYDLYFNTNCMGPCFVEVFVLLFFVGCIHGFIRYPELNPLTFGRIMSLIVPVFLALIGGLPLRRGGIHMLREKEKDAVIISGTISEIFDLPQIGFSYGNIYPNRGYGEGIVLDGIEYYLPGTGDLSAGDRVSAKVLPKSKLVLEMVSESRKGEGTDAI